MLFQTALELIWRAGVEQVGGNQTVSAALKEYSKADGIIAVGKAATPMVEAALAHSGYDTASLLVTKYGHVICRYKNNQPRMTEYQDDGTLRVIESGHPIPDAKSLEAGEALLKFVDDMAQGSHLLVLVSGGASALAEFVQADMSLKNLQQITQDFLAQGANIEAINAQRKEFSQIKHGKLLASFKGSKVTVLALSDVKGNSIEVIGSGIGMTNMVSDRVESQIRIVGTNQIARDAAKSKAEVLGFEICVNKETAYGDVNDVAQQICDEVIKGANGIYIYGGEPTVVLPDNPGKGGRNQHLALLLAKRFSGKAGIEFLVAGTDGSDGPTEAAGGFGDSESFSMRDNSEEALKCANAGEFLAKTDNLFVTGPTGTNVMDLIIIVKFTP